MSDTNTNLSVALQLHISNAYSTGEVFTHDITATVPVPPDHPEPDLDSDIVDDWAGEHLLALTGEGEQYSNVEALYEVTVTGAPAGFEYLVGYETAAQG